MEVMLDNPAKVDRLVSRLREALPLAARLTPALAHTLRRELGDAGVPAVCQIGQVDYAGDEGGIMCKLNIGSDTGERVFYVSITHLQFYGRSPLMRDIVAYQKYRLKRMRRQFAMA
jgi:hypothetical protein